MSGVAGARPSTPGDPAGAMTPGPETGREGRPPIARAALLGLCPECGAPTLYHGMVRIAPACSSCGLDFARFNVGDGPAALLVMVVGAIILPLALWLHFSLHPPVIVHLILWPIVCSAIVVGGLRMAKAALLAAEHQREGREGRIDPKTD